LGHPIVMTDEFLKQELAIEGGGKARGFIQFFIRGSREKGTVRAEFSYPTQHASKQSMEDVIHYDRLVIETSTGHILELEGKNKGKGGKGGKGGGGKEAPIDVDYEVLPKKK